MKILEKLQQDNSPPWAEEGIANRIVAKEASGSLPLFRLFYPEIKLCTTIGRGLSQGIGNNLYICFPKSEDGRRFNREG